MITCVLEATHKAVIKPIHFNTLRAITQGPTEDPALFYSRLGEAMHKYTTPQPKTPEGLGTFAIYSISKSSSNIKQKPHKLNVVPKLPSQPNWKQTLRPPSSQREETWWGRPKRDNRLIAWPGQLPTPFQSRYPQALYSSPSLSGCPGHHRLLTVLIGLL
jgi:hypothetical protein